MTNRSKFYLPKGVKVEWLFQVGLRGVQNAYKELSETIGKTGIRLMDKGEDRASIDEFKTFLS